MQKRHRLTSEADFRRTRQRGQSRGGRLLVLSWHRNEAGVTRVGISVSKRVGKAATRNRVKRRIREAVRALIARITPGWDLVFIARGAAATATFAEIAAAVDELVHRAGLYAGPPMPPLPLGEAQRVPMDPLRGEGGPAVRSPAETGGEP
ncbi:MAG: ribonuclease P protein component [Chloroflexi bacterium]|nr:ribonuclease P protein component [Chloroflexota bacterium]